MADKARYTRFRCDECDLTADVEFASDKSFSHWPQGWVDIAGVTRHGGEGAIWRHGYSYSFCSCDCASSFLKRFHP